MPVETIALSRENDERQNVLSYQNKAYTDALDDIVAKIEKAKKDGQNYIAQGVYENWLGTLSGKAIDVESLAKFAAEKYFAEQIQTISDNIPAGPALNNQFFNEIWLSDEKLNFEQIKLILVNYRALTDLTRFCVAVDFLASHGQLQSETKIAENLSEETGEGKPGRAHIELLDQAIISILERAKGTKIEGVELSNLKEELLNAAESSLILESTISARDLEENLYTGKFIDGIGIINSLLRGKYSVEVVAGIAAVAAAHEGKAPGMLTKLFEGAVKYFKGGEPRQVQISAFKPYFSEHLGSALVDRVVDKVIDDEEEEVSNNLIEENRSVSGKTSKQLRAEGQVEQAHRKDANDNVVDSILESKGFFDRLNNFVTAKKGMQLFLEGHGAFWNGLATEINKKNKEVESEKPKRLSLDGSELPGQQLRRAKSMIDFRRSNSWPQYEKTYEKTWEASVEQARNAEKARESEQMKKSFAEKALDSKQSDKVIN